MDAELKQYLDSLAANIVTLVDERIKASEARTDERIKASESRTVALIDERIKASESRTVALIDERIKASEARLKEVIDGRVDAAEERIKDYIHKSDFELETKLVAEFWKWGRTSDIRNREALSASTEASNRVQMLSERLLNAEERISALERRRLEPPAPAAA